MTYRVAWLAGRPLRVVGFHLHVGVGGVGVECSRSGVRLHGLVRAEGCPEQYRGVKSGR